MIIEPDCYFSTDWFAQVATHQPQVGPNQSNINMLFDRPHIDIFNGTQSTDYILMTRLINFNTVPVRGDVIIIDAINYVIITSEQDFTARVVTISLEVQ